MENKLTAAHVLKYMGARVVSAYSEGQSYKVVGASVYEDMIQVETNDNDTDWWSISMCQLLLTPLAKISDEDASKVAKIVESWDNGLMPVEDVTKWLDDVLSGNCATYSNYVSGNEFKILLDELRAMSYDLDNGINEGWAVDATLI